MIYLIDTAAMTGRGPFESREEAAADAEGDPLGADSIAIEVGDDGRITDVSDAVEFLEKSEAN